MSIETQLKALILEQFKSVRAFTLAIEVPYSTIDTMLKNGVGGASVLTVLKVCTALGIDIEGLTHDRIEKKVHGVYASDLSDDEVFVLSAYRQADDDDRDVVRAALRKYKNVPRLTLVAAHGGGVTTAPSASASAATSEHTEAPEDGDL